MNVYIYGSNLPVGFQGKIENIGGNGVFIQSSCNDIAVNQLVEIHCFLDSDNVFEDCHFKALVIHKETNGFGVELEDPDLQTRLGLFWKTDSLPNRNSYA